VGSRYLVVCRCCSLIRAPGDRRHYVAVDGLWTFKQREARRFTLSAARRAARAYQASIVRLVRRG